MSPRSLSPIVLVVAFALLAAPAALADLGVEKVSRSSGKPGDRVTLTLGCGSCSIRGRAIASFPISLVPVGKAPKLRRCGPNALCPPRVRAVPRRPPYTYLGEARRSAGSKDKPLQRYVLHFKIPKLPARNYTYVIYCDSCLDGRDASLITERNPNADWRLRVRR